MSSTFNGFELRAQGRITLGSRDARWLEYEWIAQGRRIRQRQVYTVSEDNGFVLTFSATPSAFEEHLEAQLLVESTFRFEA